MPLIQCLTPFKKGTKLPVGNRIYHFLPNNRRDYVADVMEQDVQTVLSISQGYQLYEGEGPLPGHEVPDDKDRDRRPAPRAQPRVPGRKPAGFGNRNKTDTVGPGNTE